jgi:hypothetical protein
MLVISVHVLVVFTTTEVPLITNIYDLKFSRRPEAFSYEQL